LEGWALGLIRILGGALCLAFFAAGAVAQPAPAVQPAIDGILAAFADHPLVAISDFHNMAQEEDFYAALVRDPRFAATVEDIVVEFASAHNQGIADRFVNGQEVSATDLRRLLSETVGFIPAGVRLGYINFFAAVRAANAGLPPSRRIRVWLGDPPIDWSKVRTHADWMPLVRQRDVHATVLIEREILARHRKALVIYGGLHFYPSEAKGPSENLGPALAHKQPLFIVTPYAGFNEDSCSKDFELAAREWPVPAIVTPFRGTSAADVAQRPDCHAAPPGNPPLDNDRFSGLAGDALLYLGPATALKISPVMPDIYLDAGYRAEMSRHYEVIMGKPLTKPTVADNPTALKPFPSYRRR